MLNYPISIEKYQPGLRNSHSVGTHPHYAFTVDVEDWYQSSVDFDAPITDRVVRNTERVMALLDECGVKATFFVQGRVAETFPHLLQYLVAQGHEVQSHGYSHKPLFQMDRRTLWVELDRARKTIEDACGVSVTAFRAPDFSILRQNLWALEVLTEVGFEVDSSIFPVRTRRYGIENWEVAPHYLVLKNGARILEVPVAIWAGKNFRFPVAGGGYFRLIPQFFLEYALRAIVNGQRPVVVYCHPYEFNENELGDYRDIVPPLYRFSQHFGRKSFFTRVRNLLTRLPFGRFDQVLETWGLM